MLHIKPPASDINGPAARPTRQSSRKATPIKTARKSVPVKTTSNRARVQDSSSQHQDAASAVRPLKKRQRKLTIPQSSSEESSSEKADDDSSSSQSSSHNPGQGPTPSYLKRLSERHNEHLQDMLKNPSAQPEPSVGVGMPPISSSQLPPTSNRPPSRQHISETAPKSNERQTDQSQSSQASSSRHTTPNMDADHLRTTTDGENDEDNAATLLPHPAQHRSPSQSSPESQTPPPAAPAIPILPFEEAEDLVQQLDPIRLASLLIRSTLLEARVRNTIWELLLWNGQFELDTPATEAEKQQFRIPLALSFGSEGLHLVILGFTLAGPTFEVALARFCGDSF